MFPWLCCAAKCLLISIYNSKQGLNACFNMRAYNFHLPNLYNAQDETGDKCQRERPVTAFDDSSWRSQPITVLSNQESGKEMFPTFGTPPSNYDSHPVIIMSSIFRFLTLYQGGSNTWIGLWFCQVPKREPYSS
jgi:hypothetical protein